MNCQQYVFLLTSDQLSQASLGQGFQAGWHLLKCRNCRHFTRKDQALMMALSERCQAEKEAISRPYKS